jgi:hypothetical protein
MSRHPTRGTVPKGLPSGLGAGSVSEPTEGAGSEAVRESSTGRAGKRRRLPHHCRPRTCPGVAGSAQGVVLFRRPRND